MKIKCESCGDVWGINVELATVSGEGPICGKCWDTETYGKFEAETTDQLLDHECCLDEGDNVINFDAAVNLMDDKIRESLTDITPCTRTEYLKEYADKHEKEYGEDFEPWVNGTW